MWQALLATLIVGWLVILCYIVTLFTDQPGGPAHGQPGYFDEMAMFFFLPYMLLIMCVASGIGFWRWTKRPPSDTY